MRKFLTKIAVAAATLAGFTNAANAFAVLSITDGTLSLTCSTQSAIGVCDSRFSYMQNTNQISFGAGSGAQFGTSFFIRNTSGDGDASLTPALTAIAATSNTVIGNQGSATGILTMTLDIFGYSSPTSLGKTLSGRNSYNTSDQAPGANSVQGTFQASSSGVMPFAVTATTGCTATLGNPTPDTATCTAAQVNWLDDGGTFAVRDIQRFTLAGGTTITGGSTLTIGVPEPTTTALVGAALLALGATTRRRNAKKA